MFLDPEKYATTLATNSESTMFTDLQSSTFTASQSTSSSPTNNESSMTETTASVNNLEDFSTLNSNGPFDVSQNTFSKTNLSETTIEQTVKTEAMESSTTQFESTTNAASVTQPSSTTPSTTQANASKLATTTTGAQKIMQETQPTSVNRLDKNCFGSFSYPKGCNEINCQYYAHWEVNEQKKTVNFYVSALIQINKWTGIGFSADGAMVIKIALELGINYYF